MIGKRILEKQLKYLFLFDSYKEKDIKNDTITPRFGARN